MNIPPTIIIRVLTSIPCVATIIRNANTTKVQNKKSTRLAPPKNERAQDLMEMFEKAGFSLEEFGENTIKLTGVPTVCLDIDNKEWLTLLVSIYGAYIIQPRGSVPHHSIIQSELSLFSSMERSQTLPILYLQNAY